LALLGNILNLNAFLIIVSKEEITQPIVFYRVNFKMHQKSNINRLFSVSGDFSMSKTVTLDARKAVKFINDGAQSNVVLFENLVHRVGEKAGKNYRLVALHNNSLMFEDTEAGDYFLAKHDRSKKGNKIHITDVSRVTIKESKKSQVFANACSDLVNGICEEDSKLADVAFKRLDSCRFRPTVASTDGFVVTRDGVRRRIQIDESVVSESNRSRIINAILHAVADNVVVEDNKVISASLGDGTEIPIPITEMDRRRMVAKSMMTVAESAHQSPGFRKFAKHIAGLVSHDKLREAVTESAQFLKEYQEFCLLDFEGFRALIENTLATQNIYNHVLAEHTALTLYRSNLKVNKDDIIDAWEKTSKLAANASLLEGVESLKSSKDFENDYVTFLTEVMTEDKDTQRKAYLNSLAVIRKTLESEIGREDEAVSQVDELINRLSSEDAADDAALSEAAELLASLDSSVIDMGTFDMGGEPDIDIGAGIGGLEAEQDVEAGIEADRAAESELDIGSVGGAGGLEPELGELGLGESEPGEEEAEEAKEAEEGEELDLSFEEEEEGEEEEGREKVRKLKRGGRKEREEEELLAASKVVPVEEMNLEVLQEEFKTWREDVNVYVAEHGEDKVRKDLKRYVERCEVLGTAELAEQFRALAPIVEGAQDVYEWDATEDETINLDYLADEADSVDEAKMPAAVKEKFKEKQFKKGGGRKGEGDKKDEVEDTEDETVAEAQRKSASTAKSRGRPQLSKRSLMKENGKAEEVEETVTEGEIDETVAVVASDDDSLETAIDAVFSNLEGEGGAEGEEGEETEEEEEAGESVTEDNDVTDPTHKSYANAEVPRKWGDGAKKDPKPKVASSPKFGKGPFRKVK